VEVKKGYKQTEIGAVPDDWNVVPITSVLERSTSITYGVVQPGPNDPTGVPFIRGGDVYQGKINESQLRTITHAVASQYKRTQLRGGEIVISLVGYPGESAIVPHSLAGANIARQVALVRVDECSSVCTRFICIFLQSNIGRRLLLNEAIGSAQQVINLRDISKVLVVLPPSQEQEAIAEVLSDADALIESLEQLVAKKRQIKHGAMQELLTGHKRLPGFSGEWEIMSVQEIADCLDNLRVPLNDSQRASMKGDFPYCGANGVLDFIDRYCVDESVVLIAEDGGYFDEYLTRPIAYRMTGKFWVNNHAHILRSKPGFDQDFLYYSLVHKNILSFLASGTRAKLNKAELFKITIRQPACMKEQTAIAAILSDMDTEIAAIESKLTKARLIKQGMMQELLTGRIRLV